MCVGVEFLAFNVLLQTKSEQKLIGNSFCALIIFKNSSKTGFSIRKVYKFTICVGRVLILIYVYLLFEKQTFYGLIKDIGKQKKL